MIEVGVTATRSGLTIAQFKAIDNWFSLSPEVDTLHHGMCIGGDESIHYLAMSYSITTVGHPPINKKFMSKCFPDITLEPKEYLVRNLDIVKASRIMLVAPMDYVEPKYYYGSGTWTTYGYAKKEGKLTIIFWPDGTVDVRQH